MYREQTPRELELLRTEHSLELQLEGMFRDLYVTTTQRSLMRQIHLHKNTMSEALCLMNRIHDIEIELREIAHKANSEMASEPDLMIAIIK